MAGFGLNLKLVLYLQSQYLTENLGFLNPPPSPSPKTLRASLKKNCSMVKQLKKNKK
jgi:hypothetical protein